MKAARNWILTFALAGLCCVTPTLLPGAPAPAPKGRAQAAPSPSSPPAGSWRWADRALTLGEGGEFSLSEGGRTYQGRWCWAGEGGWIAWHVGPDSPQAGWLRWSGHLEFEGGRLLLGGEACQRLR